MPGYIHARDRSAAGKDEDLSVADLTNSRILIVDDQPDNLRVLASVLDFAGYGNVHCLIDSREILPIFLEFQPDLVLLDLHMPHVDGLAAMDQLATVTPQGRLFARPGAHRRQHVRGQAEGAFAWRP